MALFCPTFRRASPTLIARHAARPFFVSCRSFASNIPQPMQDLMTGEVIQLPDIDVSCC